MSTQLAPDERRSYGSWTRPRSEGLFGLAWGVTIAGLGAGVLVLIGFMFGGTSFGVPLLVLSVLVLIPAGWRKGGRTGYERGILAMQWWRTVWKKEHIYRSGTFSALGRCHPPGLIASTRLYEGIASDGHLFGMVHKPEFHYYTVLLKCWPQGDDTADQEVIDDWVAAWGGFIAAYGAEADVEAIVAVNNSKPESGQRLITEVASQKKAGAPEVSLQVLDECVDELVSDSVSAEHWCSITFRATTADRRRHPEEQAVEIGRRLPGIIAALARAGVRSRPMTGDDVTAMVRMAWDPATEEDFEALAEMSVSHDVTWDQSGPVGYHERYSSLWHDQTVSVSWEMERAPDGTVDERVLKRLLEPNPALPRKRVTLIHRPHAAAEAVDIVTSDWKDAKTAKTGSQGAESAHAELREEATQQAREEQARGHGVTRMSVIVTVTTLEGEPLPSIEAATKDLTTQARLQVRRCSMFQSAAFAAGLGIGILLPDMASVPRGLAQ